MPRIEFLEPVSHEGIRYEAGNKHEVDQAFAELACGAGWAKDLDGKIATGERDTRPKAIAPQKLATAPKVKGK